MNVIEAPNDINDAIGPTVFLAGGIMKCENWQEKVISLLDKYKYGILLNPRRKNFPMHDPNAAREQITWEYNALNQADIFSMWFCDSESDQPICMYELGKHLERCAANGQLDNVVIGVEPNYSRFQDVYIQVELVSKELSKRISNNLHDHAKNIEDAVSTMIRDYMRIGMGKTEIQMAYNNKFVIEEICKIEDERIFNEL